ncbi:hypothetical protein GPL17_18135 [Bradyrhizobium yuanmingense]|nr:hypothetical protein [Bradyrhizobium yuanmingense]
MDLLLCKSREALGTETSPRHGRACPGHPRLAAWHKERGCPGQARE